MTANLGAATHQSAKKMPMGFQKKYPITQMSNNDENNPHAPHAQILDYCTKASSTKVEISCLQTLGGTIPPGGSFLGSEPEGDLVVRTC